MKGLVIGKFLPPHDGHRQLWDFAAASCDELTIVVEHIAGESIPSATRVAWVRELAPRARVVHLDRSMPQQPSEHDDFWGLWCDTLAALAGRPDLLFASEAYGAPLARGLGCTFVPVDPARLGVAISATEVRTDPHAVWRYLPPPVRAHYTRRIAVVGPESSGKTTLSRQLAEAVGGTWVPEYARAWLESVPDATTDWPRSLAFIARGQAAQEAALARQSTGTLVCDTDGLTTQIWWERLVGEPPAWLVEQAQAARYDLTLLCAPDLPWEDDPVRYLPEEQGAFFARFEQGLAEAGRRVVVVRGADRLQQAVGAWEGLAT